MAAPQLTSFEHILIGLVCLSPASGYDLKRKFAATPMGVYQPSSGSLYPAFRRLEAKGMVRTLDGTGVRFVMMEHAFSREEVLSFLDNLEDALAVFTAGLERYVAATGQLDDRHPGLALDHGLAVHRASLRWTRQAIAALRAAPVAAVTHC
jgi:hypothetical protein